MPNKKNKQKAAPTLNDFKIYGLLQQIKYLCLLYYPNITSLAWDIRGEKTKKLISISVYGIQ